MVYLIRGGRRHKIGRAGDPNARLRELQIGSPIRLILVAVGPGDSAREAGIHAQFRAFRDHGEWFNLSSKNAALAAALVEGREQITSNYAIQMERRAISKARRRVPTQRSSKVTITRMDPT